MFLGTLHGLKKDEEHHEFYTLHRFLPAFELDPAAHDAAGDEQGGAPWTSFREAGRQAHVRSGRRFQGSMHIQPKQLQLSV
jgi:hypothetical protein